MLQEDNGHSKLALLVQRYLDSDNVEGVKKRLVEEYGQSKLILLLRDGGVHTKRCAAYCLGLIGDQKSLPSLAGALKMEDAKICINAEEAMWSIWFRSGDEEIDKVFLEGVKLTQERDFEEAINKFEEAILRGPDFAEAYNQRAIVYFLLERWDESIADCQTTLILNPFHFGALAGMGHCYLRKGDLRNALKCYEKALEINPNMTGVDENVAQLRAMSE